MMKHEFERRMDKVADWGFLTVFALLGVVALVAAVGFGAWHQLLMAGVCGAMVAVLGCELKEEKGKE